MGYITVDTKRLGTKGQYVQFVTFQVSEPFRGMGVGRRLFEKVVGASSVSRQVCVVVVAGSAPVQLSPDM